MGLDRRAARLVDRALRQDDGTLGFRRRTFRVGRRALGLCDRTLRIDGRALGFNGRTLGLNRRAPRLVDRALRQDDGALGFRRWTFRVGRRALGLCDRTLGLDDGALRVGGWTPGLDCRAPRFEGRTLRQDGGALGLRRRALRVDRRALGLCDRALRLDGWALGFNGRTLGLNRRAPRLIDRALRQDDGALGFRRRTLRVGRGALGLCGWALGFDRGALGLCGRTLGLDRGALGLAGLALRRYGRAFRLHRRTAGFYQWALGLRGRALGLCRRAACLDHWACGQCRGALRLDYRALRVGRRLRRGNGRVLHGESETERQIDRIGSDICKGVAGRISQFRPICGRAITPYGVIHEVLGPLSSLPSELAVGGLDLDGQPVDHRFVVRTLLQEGLLRLDGHADQPDLLVALRRQVSRPGVPPPLISDVHGVVEFLGEFARGERPAPQDLGSGLGVLVLLVVSLGSHGIVGVDLHADAPNFALDVAFPGAPQADVGQPAPTGTLEIVRERARGVIAGVHADVDPSRRQVGRLAPSLFARTRRRRADLHDVVLDLAVRRRAVRGESAVRADAEPREGHADSRTVGDHEWNDMDPIGKEGVVDLLCDLPGEVSIEVDPRLDYAAAPVDFDRCRGELADDERREDHASLIRVSRVVVAEGAGVWLAVGFRVGHILCIAQPRADRAVPGAVFRGQCGVA